MTGTSIDISDFATPALERMQATFAEREDINDNLGARIVELCKTFVANDAPSRHETAQALGATPTGFLGAAADSIFSEADAQGATVSFTHPWFSRVGHDVDIKPVEGHYLAIPIAAESYGKRLKGNFNGGFFYHSKNGGLFYGRDYEGHSGTIQPLYVLVTEVHQEQDRSRLPSDDEMRDAAMDELKNQIFQRLEALDGRG